METTKPVTRQVRRRESHLAWTRRMDAIERRNDRIERQLEAKFLKQQSR